MKKTYRLKNLDCANCAAKMEAAILKVDGVQSAAVNFMMQRLTLTAEDSRFDDIVHEVERTIQRIEPDCSMMK